MAKLGISLLVKRCTHPHHQAGRVRFQLQDTCRPGEAIVLRRWRDRSREPEARRRGETFDGCRLPPGTFQLMHACVEAGLVVGGTVTGSDLRPYYERVRKLHPTWRAPQVDKAAALLTYLSGKRRLSKVLERERSVLNPGIPDLFLWRGTVPGVPSRGQFIEVKRRIPRNSYKEPVSLEQRAELAFLKGLGLKARAVYLIQQ